MHVKAKTMAFSGLLLALTVIFMVHIHYGTPARSTDVRLSVEN